MQDNILTPAKMPSYLWCMLSWLTISWSIEFDRVPTKYEEFWGMMRRIFSDRPTLGFVRKTQITTIILKDVDKKGELKARAWGNFGEIGFRYMANLAKRLTFLCGQNLFFMAYEPENTYEVKLGVLTRKDGTVIGFHPFANQPIPPKGRDVFVIGFVVFSAAQLKKFPWLPTATDGFHIMDRRPFDQMKADARRRVNEKADELRKPTLLRRINSTFAMNLRVVCPKGFGGGNEFIKGDVIRSDIELPVDLVVYPEGAKPEIFSNGRLFMCGQPVDETDRRKTNVNSLVMHYWAIKTRVKTAYINYITDAKEELREGNVPKHIGTGTLEKLLESTSTSDIHLKYAKFGHYGVNLNRSWYLTDKRITDFLQSNVAEKEKDKIRRLARNRPLGCYDGERRFPLPAAEFMPIKPLNAATAAGILPRDTVIADGEYIRTKIGMILNDATWILVMSILGGGDGDDHAEFVHGTVATTTTINGVVYKAGSIITIAWRYPVGIETDNKKLAVEYVILRPNTDEADRLKAKHVTDRNEYGTWLTPIELKDRPKTRAELHQPKDRILATPGALLGKGYTPYAFMHSAWAARTAKMVGSIGGVANIQMVLCSLGLAVPHWAPTETLVDGFTKFETTKKFAEQVGDMNDERIGIISNTGRRVDAALWSRVQMGFKMLGLPTPGRDTSTIPAQMFQMHHRGLFGTVAELKGSVSYSVAGLAHKKLVISEMQTMLRHVQTRLDGNKPIVFATIDRVRNDLKTELNVHMLDWNQFIEVGDMAADELIATYGWDHAKLLVLEALAWAYKTSNFGKYDQPLMQGGMFDITVQVLADLDGDGVAVNCTAAKHAKDCWLFKMGPSTLPVVTGRRSKPCSDAGNWSWTEVGFVVPAAKQKKVEAAICQATTKAGNPCTNKAQAGREFCGKH